MGRILLGIFLLVVILGGAGVTMWSSPPLHDPALFAQVQEQVKLLESRRPPAADNGYDDPRWQKVDPAVRDLNDKVGRLRMRSFLADREPIKPADREAARQALVPYEALLRRPAFYGWEYGQNFFTMRGTVKGLTLLSMLDWLDGQRQASVDRLLVALKPGLLMQGQGSMLAEMLGVSMASDTLDVLLDLLQQPVPQPARLARALEKLGAKQPPFLATADLDLAASLRMIEKAHTDRQTFEDLVNGWPFALAAIPLRRERRETINYYLDQRAHVATNRATDIPSGTPGRVDYRRNLAARHWTYAKLGAATLLAALQAWHATHHRYPERLEELVPSVLARLPRNPVAHDGLFVYSRKGSDFVLEGPGEDLKVMYQNPLVADGTVVYHPLDF